MDWRKSNCEGSLQPTSQYPCPLKTGRSCCQRIFVPRFFDFHPKCETDMAGVGSRRRRLPLRTFGRQFLASLKGTPILLFKEACLVGSTPLDLNTWPWGPFEKLHALGRCQIFDVIAARIVLVIFGVLVQPKPIPISLWRHHRGRVIAPRD